MNFLSKTFNFQWKSIPYTIGEKIVDPSSTSGSLIDSHSIWTIYEGLNPQKDQAPVTIFEFNLQDTVNILKGYDLLAKNAFKKAKLVKLPGIISVVDFIENENYLYIVTEPVVPLLKYLHDASAGTGSVSKDTKMYGIYNVGHTLQFINQKCNCIHGNINVLNSVYVNQQGEWKLFGFELLTNLTSDPDQPIYRNNQRLPGFRNTLPKEVLEGDSGIELIRQFPIKLDSYKFGYFIYNLMVTKDFSKFGHESNSIESSTLNNTRTIPTFLSRQISKLTNAKLNLRSTVEKFVNETESEFDLNLVIQFSKQLEEIKFKSEIEKLEFFKFELATYVSEENEYPPGLLDHKLLPELLNQFNNLVNFKPSVNTIPLETQQRQETMSVILNYILRFGIKLAPAQFSKLIKPIILSTFSLADRSIRLILLTHLPNFEKFLNESDIQSKIFYNLTSGFQDTNFMIRETTLKSITIIIDKVSVKQVNQDLLKILAKSQMDPKPSIRVNTLVLIIKISSKIYKNSKNSVLITALAKSLRDTFTPCKMMALSGFESLIDEFTLEEICSKILGHLAISLMDNKSAKIRDRAKQIFQLYLASVEKHASSLPKEEEDVDAEEAEFFQKHAPASTPASGNASDTDASNSASNTGGSALSFGWNMVNKLAAGGVDGQLNNDFNSSTPDLTRVGTPTSLPLQQNNQPRMHQHEVDNSWAEGMVDGDVDDGWGMDDDIEEDFAKKLVMEEKKQPVKQTPKLPVASKLNTRKTSSLKLGAKASKKPSSTLKLNLTVDEDGDDGWGDQW